MAIAMPRINPAPAPTHCPSMPPDDVPPTDSPGGWHRIDDPIDNMPRFVPDVPIERMPHVIPNGPIEKMPEFIPGGPGSKRIGDGDGFIGRPIGRFPGALQSERFSSVLAELRDLMRGTGMTITIRDPSRGSALLKPPGALAMDALPATTLPTYVGAAPINPDDPRAIAVDRGSMA